MVVPAASDGSAAMPSTWRAARPGRLQKARIEPSSPNLGTLLATFLVAAVRGALDSSLLPSAPAGVARLTTAKAVAAAVMDKRVVKAFITSTSFPVKG